MYTFMSSARVQYSKDKTWCYVSTGNLISSDLHVTKLNDAAAYNI